MDENDDISYWEDDSEASTNYSENILTSGSTGSFRCPDCGSYNTSQGVYFDKCNSCSYSQGY